MTTADTLFRPDLLARYSANGPRYTSYPTALQFRDDFEHADYLRAAADPRASATDLSLYFHIPFCDTVMPIAAAAMSRNPRRVGATGWVMQVLRSNAKFLCHSHATGCG